MHTLNGWYIKLFLKNQILVTGHKKPKYYKIEMYSGSTIVTFAS